MSFFSKFALVALAAQVVVAEYVGGGSLVRRQKGPNLGIDVVNTAGSLNAYVSALDPNNNLVMLGPNGQWYYPKATGSGNVPIDDSLIKIPLNGKGAGAKRLTLPSYATSARMYFTDSTLQFSVNQAADGKPNLVQPSAANPNDPSAGSLWGFAEFSNTADGGLYVNPTQVDFAGLPVGISISNPTGGTPVTSEGLKANSLQPICDALSAQAAYDHQPWDKLCIKGSSGQPVRILSPNLYRTAAYDPTAFNGYYDDYINQVWQKYASQPLTLTTEHGTSTCRVQNNLLTCSNDSTPYSKPSISDILGCNSGPFANTGSPNVPVLCAAFHRSTLLLDGGDKQPMTQDKFYTVEPTNVYSKLIHEYSVEGKGYAFAYDDSNAPGEAQDGTLNMNPPGLLTVTVGGA